MSSVRVQLHAQFQLRNEYNLYIYFFFIFRNFGEIQFTHS